MKLSTTTLLAVVLTSIGCSDSDEPLRGWKESEVEVVNEGAATGTTGQIVVGEGSTPMTATNVDTTTDLDMITDEQLGLAEDLDGEDGEDGRHSLADAFEPESPEPTGLDPARRRPTAESRPAPPVTHEPEPEPSPSPARPAPAREPRRAEPREQEPREPEPAETDTADEPDDSLPPIVVPPVETEPPEEEESESVPPPGDTTRTDTTSSTDRDENPPGSAGTE